MSIKEYNKPEFESLFQSIDNSKGLIAWDLDKEIKDEILNLNDQKKTALLVEIIKYYPNSSDPEKQWNPRPSTFYLLTEFLVKRKINFDNYALSLINQIHILTKIVVDNIKASSYSSGYIYILKPILNNILRYHKFEQTNELEILNNIKTKLENHNLKHFNNEKIKQIQKIDEILFKAKLDIEPKEPSTYFVGNDTFKDFANGLIDQQNDNDKNNWYVLIAHAQKANGSKPSQKYLNEAEKNILQLGTEKFKEITEYWFEFIINLKETVITNINIYNNIEYRSNSIIFLDTLNSEAIKGFVWMSSLYYDNDTIQTVGKLAEKCFKKILGKGPSAPSVGNACLYTLYSLKGLDGIAQLSRLKVKVKQSNTINLIEKYLHDAAGELGISSIEIEDLAVDDFKLEDYKITQYFDDYTCVLELVGIGKSTLHWYKQNGSEQKSVPISVKGKYTDALKKIKNKQRQIDQTTTAQKERFDRMLRSSREISLEYLKAKYLQHGLLSFVINKVIFCFTNNQESKLAIYINKQWIDVEYKQVDIEKYSKVSLWHPVSSSTEEVKQWRQLLVDKKIQQPFKQAFREIYILTDAEINTRTYSNRMASHILKQHQFITLAKGRNWNAGLLGAWDDGDQDVAVHYMPNFNLTVEYWFNALDADGHYNNIGIFNYVITDQVRFINTETNELVELTNVPAVAFSEAMRDVDLFVGVTSVGNDPTWQDSGESPNHRGYWQSYSFGYLSEIAKNRKEILLGLIPRLKISSVTHIEDKFVVVKGKIRTYKIHIGSTNILMEPNDQYLCIVPDKSQRNISENIFIPFEGDNGLSVIISKAFLLSNDDKITDTSITSQIHRQ